MTRQEEDRIAEAVIGAAAAGWSVTVAWWAAENNMMVGVATGVVLVSVIALWMTRRYWTARLNLTAYRKQRHRIYDALIETARNRPDSQAATNTVKAWWEQVTLPARKREIKTAKQLGQEVIGLAIDAHLADPTSDNLALIVETTAIHTAEIEPVEPSPEVWDWLARPDESTKLCAETYRPIMVQLIPGDPFASRDNVLVALHNNSWYQKRAASHPNTEYIPCERKFCPVCLSPKLMRATTAHDIARLMTQFREIAAYHQVPLRLIDLDSSSSPKTQCVQATCDTTAGPVRRRAQRNTTAVSYFHRQDIADAAWHAAQALPYTDRASKYIKWWWDNPTSSTNARRVLRILMSAHRRNPQRNSALMIAIATAVYIQDVRATRTVDKAWFWMQAPNPMSANGAVWESKGFTVQLSGDAYKDRQSVLAGVINSGWFRECERWNESDPTYCDRFHDHVLPQLVDKLEAAEGTDQIRDCIDAIFELAAIDLVAIEERREATDVMLNARPRP